MEEQSVREGWEEAEKRRRRDFARLEKWADRVVRELERLLRSNRWRLGCWLSLKRADDRSKEARRLAELVRARPREGEGDRPGLPEESAGQAGEEREELRMSPDSGAIADLSLPLPDTELAGASEEPRKVLGGARTITAGRGQFVGIIIPVFDAHYDLLACLESVQRHSRSEHPVIVIDDASTDERIWPLLQEWQAKFRNFRAIHNSSNLGYTATVNLGCELAGPGDLILLNSDTIVPARWVEQLAACAYSHPAVATVTAISNAAGAFSVPEKNSINSLPPGWSFDEMARFIERSSRRIRPAVPTGNGFCIYLTAAARAAVGSFDAGNFPNGYGEENDFCQRASAAGLINLIDDATYVFHRRSASFGTRKEAILKTSRATLDRLHPQYTERIREWNQNDLLDSVRGRMKGLLERADGSRGGEVLPNEERPCLLFVLHDGTGGTRFTSADLSDAVAARYRTIVLLAALDRWSLWEYLDWGMAPVRRYGFAQLWQVDRPMTPDRREVVREICADYKVSLAHVRHLLGSGPELLEVLQELGIPIVFSFHDFYTVCPTIQLLDETRTYCAGNCTAGPGDCPLPKNWFRPPLPWLKHRYVHEHQRLMGRALELCDAWITTSRTSRDLITTHFPVLDDARFTVIEHGRDLPRLELARPPVGGGPMRAIFFGDLTPAKGFTLIFDLLEKNREAGGPVELHVLGKKAQNFDPETLGAIYHGPYQREELAAHVEAIAPSVSLIPSPWPETYCHVLTESWAMGLPVLVSDIGTLRERVLRHGGGWLLPVDEAEQWLKKLVALMNDPPGYAAALAEVRTTEFPSVEIMARQYEAIYERLLETRAGSTRTASA